MNDGIDTYHLAHDGRLERGPSEHLVRAGFGDEIAHAPALAHALSLADIAHAVMLAEADCIDAATARDLLGGLLELDAIPANEFPWLANSGDAFNSREKALTERIGASAAGWLSAGRPRREAFRVALRLRAMWGTAALHAQLLALAKALHTRATEFAATPAADYTYLQHAQPSTLGHLLLGYLYPVQRDLERLERLHSTFSQSVAGSGGTAGSRWPLSRERLSELLGCAAPVEHTKDAMWQWDAYVELLAAIASSATGLSQLSQDLEIFASSEFGFVELADEHSRASALMPQKKNPYALVVVRTQAGKATGDLTAALTTLHTGSARTDHFQLLNGLVPDALTRAESTAALLAEVVTQLTFNTERIEQTVMRSWVWGADVTDAVAQSGDVDYRRAHTAVGRALREAHASGTASVDPEWLAAALTRELADLGAGDVTVTRDLVADAMDVRAAIASRPQSGSSSPAAMETMLDDVGATVAEARERQRSWEDRIASARSDLYSRARALSSANPTAAASTN